MAKISDTIYQKLLLLENQDYFMITSAVCWIQLRSISYSINNIKKYKYINVYGFFDNFLENLAYTLYLPTLFLGPLISYQEFVKGVSAFQL